MILRLFILLRGFHRFVPCAGAKALFYSIGLALFLGGCASPAKVPLSGHSSESAREQLEAAEKVVGGMTGRPVSREDMNRVARELRTNEDSRSAVQKIIGLGSEDPPVEKYSPLTGRHYSGRLEYEPGTGVKLLPIVE